MQHRQQEALADFLESVNGESLCLSVLEVKGMSEGVEVRVVTGKLAEVHIVEVKKGVSFVLIAKSA